MNVLNQNQGGYIKGEKMEPFHCVNELKLARNSFLAPPPSIYLFYILSSHNLNFLFAKLFSNFYFFIFIQQYFFKDISKFPRSPAPSTQRCKQKGGD